MRPISITASARDAALGKLERGLASYSWLQAELHKRNVEADREFQKKFGGFYRVRRNAQWRGAFFGILERAKTSPLTFGQALRRIHEATGRVEASFASKLVASIDPDQPVIDSIVVGNLGLKLPKAHAPNRLQDLEDVHRQMAFAYKAYLDSREGRRLVEAFRRRYPDPNLSAVKMVDLVLWKTSPSTN